MQLTKLLSSWRSDVSIGGNISAWEILPAHTASLFDFPDNLHPVIAEALRRRGIKQLYSHQAVAWQELGNGKDVVISTGTASGKTLCYNLPVLDQLIRHPNTCALYLFPTKALSQDQSNTLSGLINEVNSILPSGIDSQLPNVRIYDGDTSTNERAAIRKNSRVVFSNPDMLHKGIMPHHSSWAQFFANLRYVIIDEMHVYRGVFGSHISNVIRRLKRICRHYGSEPQFILTSATIGNPLDLARKMIETEIIGRSITLIERDGSAHGEKYFLIYNPPVIDPNLGLRRSSWQEAIRLADDLLTYGLQTVIFARTRRSVEILLTYLREKVEASSIFSREQNSLDGMDQIRGYRAGYLPSKRREIERGLREGRIKAVVATTALELGIDIGTLAASLMVGYPGSIAGTWQQAGRSGRTNDASLALLVTTADPLDQFLASHPEYLFSKLPEHALINPDNLLILMNHLKCAAFELPFQSGERFGSVDADLLQEFLELLYNERLLFKQGDRYYWMADQYPAQNISLRSASPENILLQFGEHNTIIGEVDRASADWLVHPQAVYLHEGQTFLVDALDFENHRAHLIQTDLDYFTEASRKTTVSLVEMLNKRKEPGCTICYGEIMVTSQVVGFRKMRWYTNENLGYGELDLPQKDLLTTAYWIVLDDEVVEELRNLGLWTNDPNEYGPNWQKQRDLARRRDGYRCQVCGVLESNQTHHVHHKTPFRSFTSYEVANQLSNLTTLCPGCHKRAELAVRLKSGLAGLSYVIGHLSPLFVMCDSRDLGLHYDAQSPMADDKPVVVIYDQIPAGIGLSQHLFEVHSELVYAASTLVSSCPCVDSCPSCVGPGGEAGYGGKAETIALLKRLIQ